MGRQESVARSVVLAIAANTHKKTKSLIATILTLFSTFFTLFQLSLEKVRPADFSNLRRNHWEVDDDAYADSFRPAEGGKLEDALKPIGDMGYSGSTFYATADQKYLVKSVPRHSEHSFFRDDLLTPYVEYMAQQRGSLIVRICDFLAAPRASLGRMLGLAPSHHIVMENILYGREEAWQHWDLKPTSYFYPERDVADGRLASEATKSQLADEFPDKIVLGRDEAEELFAQLQKDTALLAGHNAVDYSLFLVRIEVAPGEDAGRVADELPTDPPSVPPRPPSWRTGMPSADGKHVYRAAILDFFWAKHKAQPLLMTLLIKAYNVLISRKGHMSITTTPDEYRERFMKMVRDYVEIKEDEA